MSLEERIHKVFEKVTVSCDISALDAIVSLRTKVLQILPDYVVVSKDELREPERKFSFLIKDRTGYYVFEKQMYAVGKPTKFRDLTQEQKEANSICFVEEASEARLICRALDILELIEEKLKEMSK